MAYSRIQADIEGDEALYNHINANKVRGKVSMHVCNNAENIGCTISIKDGEPLA